MTRPLVRDVPRPVLLESVYDALISHGCCVLASEPGMGRHSISRMLSDRLRFSGYIVRLFKFSQRSSESSLRRFRKCMRSGSDLVEEGSQVFVVVDGVGDYDDGVRQRIARAMEYGVLSGIKVLCLLGAHSELFIDEIAFAKVFRGSGLAVTQFESSFLSEFSCGRSASECLSLTNGIPFLLTALPGLSISPLGEPVGSCWAKRAESLLLESLSSRLIDEELRLRCAMATLGVGTLGDISSLGIRVSSDVMLDCAFGSPVLGIDARAGRFSLIGCPVAVVGHVLETACARWPKLFRDAVQMLVRRGDFRRAGLLLESCGLGEGWVAPLAAYPLEFLDAGFTGLLIDRYGAIAREYPESSHAIREMFDLLGVSLKRDAAMRSSEDDDARTVSDGGCVPNPFSSSFQDRRSSALRPETQEQLVCLRELRCLSKEGDAVPCAHAGDDRMAQTILCHARIRSLLLGGNALGAFRELLVQSGLRAFPANEPSVFAGLLQLAFEALRIIVGDPLSPRDRELTAQASSFLEASRVLGLCDDGFLLLEFSKFMAGLGPAPDCSEALTRVGRDGSGAMSARLHLMSALGDASGGALRRAWIHVGEALKESAAHGMADVWTVTGLVGSIVLSGLGESPREMRLDDDMRIRGAATASNDVAALADAYRHVWSGDPGCGAEARRRLVASPPRLEVALLASLLCRIDAKHGATVSSWLPECWKRRADRDERGICDASTLWCGQSVGSHKLRTAGLDTAPALSGQPKSAGLGNTRRGTAVQTHCHDATLYVPPLRISVFGGLSVWIGETRVPERAWGRRHARTLMALMALSPGHDVSRIEAAEALWPGIDYARGRVNLCTVVTSLRTTLGQPRGKALYVGSEMGRLWLDGELVSCDIDAFEDLARSILAPETEDGARVDMCRRLESAYRGGTVQPSADALGRFARRHAEVSGRYVEALVSGAEAAVRLGQSSLAVWLARSAAAEAPEREDLSEILALSLEADGRQNEATEARRRHCAAGNGAGPGRWGGSGHPERPT